MSQQKTTIAQKANEINIREEIEKYFRYWPWFLLCTIAALAIAFFYLRYTTNIYPATATIIIKDGKNSQSSELAAFEDLGLFTGMSGNSIENEIGILRSRRLMESVVKALDINIQYFDTEALRNSELYTSSPYLIELLNFDKTEFASQGDQEFILNVENEKVILSNAEGEVAYRGTLGTPMEIGFASITVYPNELVSGGKDKPVRVKFNTVEAVARNYSNQLNIGLKEKNSSLIELGLNDPVKRKAEDILDQLILEYNREAIEDKNIVALNTADFIDERLLIINEELDSVETGKADFKENNKLTDIQSESEMYVENAGQNRLKLEEISTQIELINAMISYLQKSDISDLLPANLGISESGINQQINSYNELVLERNRILKGSSDKNPVIIKLTTEIEQLRQNIQVSLERTLANLKITQNNLESQVTALNSRISSVPGQEKQFRGIERQQQIKEALYLFLLQKREENSLSLAVTAPKAKIVDNALSSNIPVSPNTRSIYLTALLIGLGLPFAFIYFRNLLNNKVESRTDIEDRISDVSIVGEIPRIGKGMAELIEKNDRSVLAESFRILHTNLQYLLVNTGNKKKGVKIFITSTIKGEGKTFIAFNTATTLANSGKKVLIMGADLRNPQLQRFEADAKLWLGVSDYLANNDLQLNDLLRQSTLHENLDLLASGSIPPNPSELLRHSKTKDLFEKLEEMYDYIIVDTAPSMLVSDTFLINAFADLTLYVVRADYTERKLLDFPENSRKEGKLQNLSFVLNDVKAANFGYGNKYGYAYGYSYGAEEQSFWKKLRNKAAFW